MVLISKTRGQQGIPNCAREGDINNAVIMSVSDFRVLKEKFLRPEAMWSNGDANRSRVEIENAVLPRKSCPWSNADFGLSNG
jgi:hypothetical protein